MMFYVYTLKSSIDDLIFYVGKGSGDRMYRHIEISKFNGVNRKKNPHLYNKISKIFSDGGEVIFEIFYETVDEDDAYSKERELIENIGIDNLTNITEGGRGGQVGKWTDERRLKLSLSKTGKPRSDEVKEKISKSLTGRPTGRSFWKGKKLPEEVKEKMRESGKGKNRGPITEKRRLAIIEGIRKRKEKIESKV